jgi:homoprotocatechuate degradation regulator HpaR
MSMADVADSALPDDALMPRNVERSLPIALLRAREVVMARFRPIVAAHDLTEQQWRVLRVLGEQSPIDATDLAEQATVLAPSLTRIIKSLEDRQLIMRVRDEVDRRKLVLSITAGGIALIRDVAPSSREIYADLEAKFGHERLEHLIDLLIALAAVKL